jgi:hypothetical protein
VYASLLKISGLLYAGVFEQPAGRVSFRPLLVQVSPFYPNVSAMKERMIPRFPFLLLSLLALLCAAPGISQAQEPRKILSIEAYDMLNAVPNTYLIDVRTRAEYQFVGHPFKAYLYPYQFFTHNFAKGGEKPGYQLSVKNKAFLEQIGKAF